MDETYEPIMAGRLADKRIAVVYLGESDAGLDDDVDRTLEDAGLSAPANVTALALPVDVDRIAGRLASVPELSDFAGSSNLEPLGEALGLEFAAGGDRPLWDELQGDLAAQTIGGILEPLDSVILVRSWRPVETESPIETERNEQTDALIRGFVSGLVDADIVVVGVEGQGVKDEESAIELFKSLDVSSVDDVDTVPGRVALAVLLSGGEPGHYGVDEERIIPGSSCSCRPRPTSCRPSERAVRCMRQQGPALGSRDPMGARVAHRLAVLVAARDEEGTIGPLVGRLRAAFPGAEVVAADDGSRDRTAERARCSGRDGRDGPTPRQGRGAHRCGAGRTSRATAALRRGHRRRPKAAGRVGLRPRRRGLRTVGGRRLRDREARRGDGRGGEDGARARGAALRASAT